MGGFLFGSPQRSGGIIPWRRKSLEKTGSLKSFFLFIEENFINFLENLAYDCKTIHISLGLEAEPPEASKLKLIQ